MNLDQLLSQFQATGLETSFHDRHINPQILAGLNGRNWGLKDYEARGGFQALRKILGQDGSPANPETGVAGMTRALARELGSRGITVNCIAPGFIETDMTASLPEEQQKALLGQIPLGHLGKPQDIAHAVAFIASPEAGYITGQEIHVNGGMYM